MAGHLRQQQLDRPVGEYPLDSGHRARVAAARHVAALRHIDRAIAAERRAPGRATGARVAADLSVGVDEQLAGVAVTEHDPALAHDHRAFGETKTGREQRSFHAADDLRRMI
jgi:hypothetical protein